MFDDDLYSVFGLSLESPLASPAMQALAEKNGIAERQANEYAAAAKYHELRSIAGDLTTEFDVSHMLESWEPGWAQYAWPN